MEEIMETIREQKLRAIAKGDTDAVDFFSALEDSLEALDRSMETIRRRAEDLQSALDDFNA